MCNYSHLVVSSNSLSCSVTVNMQTKQQKLREANYSHGKYCSVSTPCKHFLPTRWKLVLEIASWCGRNGSTVGCLLLLFNHILSLRWAVAQLISSSLQPQLELCQMMGNSSIFLAFLTTSYIPIPWVSNRIIASEGQDDSKDPKRCFLCGPVC